MANPRNKNKTSQLQANLFEENITTISLSLKKNGVCFFLDKLLLCIMCWNNDGICFPLKISMFTQNMA